MLSTSLFWAKSLLVAVIWFVFGALCCLLALLPIVPYLFILSSTHLPIPHHSVHIQYSKFLADKIPDKHKAFVADEKERPAKKRKKGAKGNAEVIRVLFSQFAFATIEILIYVVVGGCGG
jgi:hypothetical protein